MSIASDFRTYADTAVAQGKTAVAQSRQVLDQSLATAQAQLNDVTGTATDYASTIAEKATETVFELRVTAEKAINLEALKTAVEPYLAHAREYGTSVTDRAEGVLTNLRSDKRVAKVLDSATAVSGVVLVQVNDRIVKPVQSLTGIGVKPAAPARKPAPKPAVTKPAAARKTAARPAAKKAPARKSPARKSATS
ncbi:hypothetical protein [uncultured Jatrophihabitans sp.]|uniref:hypothetical protein n=1 Tax=uncultured Jatrophihabitans sp. TaxID=1610747 RepID=UPI0035CB5F4E